jgi:4-hydroxybenzoate polyprenyltransferase/phosphoserine phosphatase
MRRFRGGTMDQIENHVSDIPLIRIDTLQEAFAQLLLKHPTKALRALFMLTRGRAVFKAIIADHVLPDPQMIPFNETVLETVRMARKQGRKVYLATAADKRFAEIIASSMDEFDGVFASDKENNLKGKNKADRLVAAFGVRGFDYIGNSAVDLPVWRAARTALIASPHRELIERLKREVPNPILLGGNESRISAYFWALRPHQWLKNALLFLPLLAAHKFSSSALVTILFAFVSFSLGASSIYLINDIFDLQHDRAHAEKRHRPFAAGDVALSHGAILFFLLASLSISLALFLPVHFIFALFGYFVLSLSYTFYLKRKLMIDVVTLAALYGIRVVAGGVATGITLSHWLVGFCFFIFLSLALVKRLSEMIALQKHSVQNIKGRGYRRDDLPIINSLTAASGFVSVLVLALYINSPEVKNLYHRPDLLWGICVILVYWLGRAFLLAGRGEIHQDPVIFTATDRNSLLAAILVAVIFWIAL